MKFKSIVLALALLAPVNGLFANHVNVAEAIIATIPELPVVAPRTIFALPKITLPKVTVPSLETVKNTVTSAASTAAGFCLHQAARGFNWAAENKIDFAAYTTFAALVAVEGFLLKKLWNQWLNKPVRYHDYVGDNWWNHIYLDRWMTRRDHKRLYGTYFNVKPKSPF